MLYHLNSKGKAESNHESVPPRAGCPKTVLVFLRQENGCTAIQGTGQFKADLYTAGESILIGTDGQTGA